MTRAARKYITPEEYLALEETAPYKSEYYRGEIFAREGGGLQHSLIAVNLLTKLHGALRGKACSVFNSDMRHLVKKNNLYAYPDVSVVCGKVELVEGRNDTITNPVLIVEVLSPSTRKYSLQGKFALYQALPSLQNYLAVDRERVYVEYYQRSGPSSWILEIYEGLEDVIALQALDVELALAEVYDKVEFEIEG